MTTSRKPKTEKERRVPLQNGFKGFANIKLPQGAKEDIVHESKLTNALETVLQGLLSEGYKVSVVQNKNDDSYQATAYGTEESGRSSGYATSAYSEDITRAVLALSYKVFQVADGDLSGFAVQSGREMDV